ncbi:hypothetical protein H0H92_006798 [Tricholoma furcatifolium]|nr:hypothetical protein H0H92_006798 [Tricholoma furcatifolium]
MKSVNALDNGILPPLTEGTDNGVLTSLAGSPIPDPLERPPRIRRSERNKNAQEQSLRYVASPPVHPPSLKRPCTKDRECQKSSIPPSSLKRQDRESPESAPPPSSKQQRTGDSEYQEEVKCPSSLKRRRSEDRECQEEIKRPRMDSDSRPLEGVSADSRNYGETHREIFQSTSDPHKIGHPSSQYARERKAMPRHIEFRGPTSHSDTKRDNRDSRMSVSSVCNIGDPGTPANGQPAMLESPASLPEIQIPSSSGDPLRDHVGHDRLSMNDHTTAMAIGSLCNAGDSGTPPEKINRKREPPLENSEYGSQTAIPPKAFNSKPAIEKLSFLTGDSINWRDSTSFEKKLLILNSWKDFLSDKKSTYKIGGTTRKNK